MGEIINLKAARKAKAKREREAGAAENRARFGQPKAERERAEARAEQDARRLSGHHLGKRSDEPEPSEPGGSGQP